MAENHDQPTNISPDRGRPSERQLDAETRDTFELVHQAHDGDLVAWESLFERFYPQVLAIVRRRLGPGLRRHEESRDLLHDAMVKAIRAFQESEVSSVAAFVAWLARIVENQIRHAARKHSNRRDAINDQIVQHINDSISGGRLRLEPTDEEPSPSQEVARTEMSERVRETLATLSEPYREVIRLRDFENLPWARVAEELDRSSPDAARQLHARALIELAKRLGRSPQE